MGGGLLESAPSCFCLPFSPATQASAAQNRFRACERSGIVIPSPHRYDEPARIFANDATERSVRIEATMMSSRRCREHGVEARAFGMPDEHDPQK